MNKVLFCLLGIFFIIAHADDYERDDGVLVLTSKNFDNAIKEFEHILVEFYAPWCGHCKSLAPEYSKAAKKLLQDKSKIALAKVDATVENELGQRFSVRGYPTLKFFNNGNPTEYKGGRTEKEIISWVVKKSQPSIREINDMDLFEDEIRDNDVVVIFWGDKNNQYYHTFDMISRGFDEIAFIYTTDSEIAEKYQGSEASLITIYKRFDEFKVDYSGPIEYNPLREFISDNQYPIVMDFNDKAAERIFQQNYLPGMLLFVKPRSQEGRQAEKAFREVATNQKGKSYFAIVNVEDGSNNRIMEFFGVRKEDAPTVRLAKPTEGMPEKYRLEDDITIENLKQFLHDFETQRLRVYFKSEPTPKDNSQPLKTVVANNFKKIVLDPTKDVLIEFYAPWCGHCQRMSPILESTASRLAKVPNLIIAKMDATMNEVEGISIRSYPTFKWYPAFKKHAPVDVEDLHSEDDIVEFVRDHLTKKYTDEL